MRADGFRCGYCARVIWPWQHYVLASGVRFHISCRTVLYQQLTARHMERPDRADGWTEAELREAWGR